MRGWVVVLPRRATAGVLMRIALARIEHRKPSHFPYPTAVGIVQSAALDIRTALTSIDAAWVCLATMERRLNQEVAQKGGRRSSRGSASSSESRDRADDVADSGVTSSSASMEDTSVSSDSNARGLVAPRRRTKPEAGVKVEEGAGGGGLGGGTARVRPPRTYADYLRDRDRRLLRQPSGKKPAKAALTEAEWRQRQAAGKRSGALRKAVDDRDDGETTPEPEADKESSLSSSSSSSSSGGEKSERSGGEKSERSKHTETA